MIRIIATSDLHGNLPVIQECDLLILGGDICPDGSSTHQAQWLDQNFRSWLDKVPAKEVVAIAGNHDLIFERAENLIPTDLRWHYLKDQQIELFGFKIYGTPWQLPFWGAFNLNEEGLARRYEKIPDNIDILISHGPAYGILDEVPSGHVGSTSLRKKIFELKPKLVICGHIHDAFGVRKIDNILFANVSLLNDRMEVAHPPALFDLNAQ